MEGIDGIAPSTSTTAALENEIPAAAVTFASVKYTAKAAPRRNAYVPLPIVGPSTTAIPQKEMSAAAATFADSLSFAAKNAPGRNSYVPSTITRPSTSSTAPPENEISAATATFVGPVTYAAENAAVRNTYVPSTITRPSTSSTAPSENEIFAPSATITSASATRIKSSSSPTPPVLGNVQNNETNKKRYIEDIDYDSDDSCIISIKKLKQDLLKLEHVEKPNQSK